MAFMCLIRELFLLNIHVLAKPLVRRIVNAINGNMGANINVLV